MMEGEGTVYTCPREITLK